MSIFLNSSQGVIINKISVLFITSLVFFEIITFFCFLIFLTIGSYIKTLFFFIFFINSNEGEFLIEFVFFLYANPKIPSLIPFAFLKYLL